MHVSSLAVQVASSASVVATAMQYPGKTLYELITLIQKHLEQQQRSVSLINHKKFPSLCYALHVSMKRSATAGLGRHPKQALCIIEEQEDELWRILDVHSSWTSASSFLHNLGKFCSWGGKPHCDLTIDSFMVEKDSEGLEYLSYTKKVGKTQQGGLKYIKIKPHKARAYAGESLEWCPVRIFQKYISLCPKKCWQIKAFYLRPLKKTTTSMWHGKSPVGHNTLNNMVKSVMSDAGFKGHYTNFADTLGQAHHKVQPLPQGGAFIMGMFQTPSLQQVQQRWTFGGGVPPLQNMPKMGAQNRKMFHWRNKNQIHYVIWPTIRTLPCPSHVCEYVYVKKKPNMFHYIIIAW